MSRGYPSDWNSRRKKVYKRDNYTCQNCGAKGGSKGNAELHAHHIVPKSKGGTHQLGNLKTMCNRCHKSIHGSSMAPTSKVSVSDQNTSQLRKEISSSIFSKCPFCESTRFGDTDGRTICLDCNVVFERRKNGLEMIESGSSDSPSNQRVILKGFQLDPYIWKEVGKIDIYHSLDFRELEKQSKELSSKRMKLILATLGFSILVLVLLSVLINLLAGFIACVLTAGGGVIWAPRFRKQIREDVIDIEAAKKW